ncbi:MAG TPA: 2Fe-2S iron-sulfur cluster-binding protein [Anaeromyxobacteraceae bacterium]
MPRLADPRFAPDCEIRFDGRRVPARAGESVASALVAAGLVLVARSAKYHRPRGPFCLAGSCGSCQVRVDGLPNLPACATPCRDGLRVETQNTLGRAGWDLLAAIDRLAPHGIDHHHLVTWNRWANRVAVAASRRLAGLGRLGDRAPPPWPPAAEERFEALVAGAGPAGLGAALALARAGRRVLVAERGPRAGGRLRCRLDLPGDPPPSWIDEAAAAVRAAGGEVATGAAVLGLWRDGGSPLAGVAAQGAQPRLRLIRAPAVVVACGAHAEPPVFEGNDLPGIFGARGLLAALAEDGVLPGERVAVLGPEPEAEAAAARLRQAGAGAVRVPGPVRRARGRRRVAGLDLEGGARIACDAVAVAGRGLPAAELARQAGGSLEVDATGGFRLRTGPAGEAAPGVWAAGEAAGPCTAREAAEAGRRAGEAAARV